MGIIHFSASFDQGLLTVTKMVMTICIHMVIFGAQVSIIYFYYVSEHLKWTLYQKVRKTMLPTAITAFAFGVTEATFVGVHWNSSVLERGIGSLTTFWIIVRTFLVLAYAITFLMGLIPWTTMHFPSMKSPFLKLPLIFKRSLSTFFYEICSPNRHPMDYPKLLPNRIFWFLMTHF